MVLVLAAAGDGQGILQATPPPGSSGVFDIDRLAPVPTGEVRCVDSGFDAGSELDINVSLVQAEGTVFGNTGTRADGNSILENSRINAASVPGLNLTNSTTQIVGVDGEICFGIDGTAPSHFVLRANAVTAPENVTAKPIAPTEATLVDTRGETGPGGIRFGYSLRVDDSWGPTAINIEDITVESCEYQVGNRGQQRSVIVLVNGIEVGDRYVIHIRSIQLDTEFGVDELTSSYRDSILNWNPVSLGFGNTTRESMEVLTARIMRITFFRIAHFADSGDLISVTELSGSIPCDVVDEA